MASISIKGPITELVVDALDSQDQSPPTATFDDILEEGASFPSEEEATQNLIAGEAEQASVKLVFAFPVLDSAEDFVDRVTAFANTRRRVFAKLTNAKGVQRIYGGDKGMRVRRVVNDDMGYGKIGATLFTFESTHDKSGDGVETVD